MTGSEIAARARKDRHHVAAERGNCRVRFRRLCGQCIVKRKREQTSSHQDEQPRARAKRNGEQCSHAGANAGGKGRSGGDGPTFLVSTKYGGKANSTVLRCSRGHVGLTLGRSPAPNALIQQLRIRLDREIPFFPTLTQTGECFFRRRIENHHALELATDEAQAAIGFANHADVGIAQGIE